MKTEITKGPQSLTVKIEGSVDTVTAPELEKTLKDNWEGITELTLDFARVDYISSAGLRVVMAADKHMGDVGAMTIINVNADVREVFEMTGFDELLNIK